jgi:hypothetical protein
MLFAILYLSGIFVSIVAAARQMARRRRLAREHPRDLVVSTRAGLALGAMFLGFQQIVQPEVRYVIAEQEKEDMDEEGNGEEEPSGGRLFHQQLRKIRKGEEVGELTVRVDATSRVDGVETGNALRE